MQSSSVSRFSVAGARPSYQAIGTLRMCNACIARAGVALGSVARPRKGRLPRRHRTCKVIGCGIAHKAGWWLIDRDRKSSADPQGNQLPMNTNSKRNEYITRDAIMKLLSDEEVARVSTLEAEPSLANGQQYVDLKRLNRGIRMPDNDFETRCS